MIPPIIQILSSAEVIENPAVEAQEIIHEDKHKQIL